MSKKRADRESGVVSIFIVIFFMILVSVIIIGFIKIIGDEQRQTTDNDLTSSALASAQSGAEDGKRALLHCQRINPLTDPAGAIACASLFSSTSCDSLTSQAALTGPLGIDTLSGEGVVSDNPDYQQRYTCLTIKKQTPTVEDISVTRGKSQLIPLKSALPFNKVVFSWHATAGDRNGTPTIANTSNVISQPDWTTGKYPAMIRLEFINYPITGLQLGTLDAATKTIFLTPGAGGTNNVTLSAADMRALDPNSRTPPSPILTRCNASSAYACTVTIDLGPLAPTNTYFVRVSAIYANAYLQMSLQNSAGVPVNFDDVQPIIDVTGRANDVFRRIQTRVQYDSGYFIPEYALESAATICKDMLVTDQSATSVDICNP